MARMVGSGQDYDRRARYTMSALRGREGDAEHKQEIADQQRRVRRLGDEDHRQRQVDPKGIEVEGITGGSDQPDHRFIDAHYLELEHDRRQYGIGGGGGEHDGESVA